MTWLSLEALLQPFSFGIQFSTAARKKRRRGLATGNFSQFIARLSAQKRHVLRFKTHLRFWGGTKAAMPIDKLRAHKFFAIVLGSAPSLFTFLQLPCRFAR